MDGTTAQQRIAEHRDVLKGFDAQIARLDREEDELFRKMERGQSRDEAQVVFDALAKVKGQKQKMGTLRKEEMASFERWVSQNQVQGLQPAAGADDHRRRQESGVRPLPTGVIDLSLDEGMQVPVRQVGSTLAGRKNARSLESADSPQQQRSVAKGMDLSFGHLTASPKKSFPATCFPEDFAPVAKSHPTVIEHPTAEGAMELRCPSCGTNMKKGGLDFLDGVNGFSRHLMASHKDLLAPGDCFSYRRTFELCSYRAVSQDVVDALLSGKSRAYVVEKVYQKLGS